MKEETLKQLKTTIYKQIVQFDQRLFDHKWEKDSQKVDLRKKVDGLVDICDKQNVDDYDLWVFLTFRQGKMRSKNSCIKELEPKSLVDALLDGFEIPDDASMVEIEIKPVLNKKYDRNVVEFPIYSVRFGLGKEENLTEKQLKRRYKLNGDDNLYSIQDMQENSKILQFYNRKKRAKERFVSKDEGLGL